MMELRQPKATVLYDYDSLAHFVSVWWGVESREPWTGTGFASCTSMCKQAVSSRQWDSSAGLLDDELERNTATIMGECIDKLEAVDRALVMYGQCAVKSSWVEEMQPERAQFRYESALLQLAMLARSEGVDV